MSCHENYSRACLGTVRVGLVGEIGTGSTGGVTRSTVLGVALVVVVVASLHLVVVTERSVRAVLVTSTTEELLAVRSAVLLLIGSALRLAAADGEHPEETSTEGESGGNSDAGEESTVDVTLDTIKPGRGLHSTNNSTSQDTRQNNGGDNEGASKTGDDPCQAGHDTRAVGKDSENDLSSKSNEGSNVDDLGPLGGSSEGLESTLDFIGELNGDVLVGTDESRGVERLAGPVKLRVLTLSLAILVDLAETPEVDVVVLVETEHLGGDVILDGSTILGTSQKLGHITGVDLEFVEV